MKVYLDDVRDTPIGWERTYTVAQTIELLKTNQVTHLSLDHDLTIQQTLGYNDNEPTGYDVLLWIEQQVMYNPVFKLPQISIHSMNPSGAQRMRIALASIVKRYNNNANRL